MDTECRRTGGRTAKGVADERDMVHLMDHPYYVVWGMSPKQIYPYRGPRQGIGDLVPTARRERGARRRFALASVMRVGISWSAALAAIQRDDPHFVDGLNKSRLHSRRDSGSAILVSGHCEAE